MKEEMTIAEKRPSRGVASMAQWQTGEVMANGIRINYTRTGGEKPRSVRGVHGGCPRDSGRGGWAGGRARK